MNDEESKPRLRPPPTEPIVPRQAGQQLTVAEALAQAGQHQAAGRLPAAETLLRRILSAQPKNAAALHLLGVVSHQQGQTALGVQLVNEAIEVDATKPVYHANKGEMCRILGDLDEAIASGGRALALQPRYPAALSNVGIAYFDKEAYDEAEKCQRQALAIDPDLPAARNNLASIYRERKDRASAIREYRRIVETHPEYVEAVNNLGAVLTEDDRPEEAQPLLLRAIEVRPNYADAHSNLGLALLAQEQYDQALVAFDRALKLRPDYLEAHMGAAKVLQQTDQLPAAKRLAARAIELDPSSAEAYGSLASIQAEMGYPDRARALYDEALRLDADSVKGLTGLGTLLMELGDLDEAERSYRRALDVDAESIAARLALVQVKKVRAGDDNLAALESEGRQIGEMSRLKATAFHFALGKCYDDIGEYDKAFPHFLEGGRLKRSGLEYDPGETERTVDAIGRFFDDATLARLQGGESSDVPVFVLGMPRSGTTLTEQIIASHPLAHGAGELPDILDLAANPRGTLQQGSQLPRYPETLHGMTQADIRLMGARYVEGLRARAPEAMRITDKMPANFFCIGLIHLMLPNAKIVHVRRDPVDTCLSGFSKLFAKGQPHSYDLTELGRYYCAYARLMDHWRSVLPDEAMLEVQYEELVGDNETQARRLIDYCGLEWDDACLDFHKTDRSIRTASVIQVRQPIYRTSMQRWRNYEAFLEPLFDALGDVAPER